MCSSDLGGSALSLHHSWDGLVQNVINIFCTFLWCDFLCPEFLDSVHQLLLVAWLHFGLQKELQLVPQVLDRVEVRTFRGRFPPFDAVLFKEGFACLEVLRGMLWVIVLHKTMIGQLLCNERDQSGFKDITEENSIHDAIKDANLCGTMSANPTPNMNFNCGCFGFGLRFIGLSIFL